MAVWARPCFLFYSKIALVESGIFGGPYNIYLGPVKSLCYNLWQCSKKCTVLFMFSLSAHDTKCTLFKTLPYVTGKS
jgi:hypothetical protein